MGEKIMLRPEVLMATLLVLVPITGFPIVGRQLVLWEVWPGHGVQYQQVSGAASKSRSYKITVYLHFDQSAQKKDSRNFESFRRNLEVPKKNTNRNRPQQKLLKYVILYKRNLITYRHVSMRFSRKHLGINTSTLRMISYLGNMQKNILKNEKLGVKMNWHSIFSGILEKIKTKNNVQFQITYFENKPNLETESLGSIALQINVMFKTEQKSEEGLENTVVLKPVKQKTLSRKKHIENRMLQKEITSKLIGCHQWKFSKDNRNPYSKNHYGMFMARKKTPITKNFQQGIIVLREKTKAWKQKPICKKVTSKSQKLALIFAITKQNVDSIKKIIPPNKNLWSAVQEEIQPALVRNIFRNIKLIRKLVNMPVYSPIIYVNFPKIKIAVCMKHELFHSAIDQAKRSLCTTKLLKHFMQLLQGVEKHITDTRKGLSTILKVFMVKKPLDTEKHFPALFFIGPSAVGRTKRSANVKTEEIPVDLLRHLTSAFAACATIFGIALFALALALCYLYYKRRYLGQFLDTALNDGECRKGSKSIDSRCYGPVSLSQSFHFAQPQEPSKNEVAQATATEACSKNKSDVATVKEIYSSSDSEGSSKMSPRGLTVRSRAYVCPSWSTDSIRSFCDDVSDVSSSRLFLSDEIIVGNKYSNSSSATKEEELLPVVHQSDNCLSDRQELRTSTDLLQQLQKKTTTSQLYLSDEMTAENPFSNPSTTIPKEELVSSALKPEYNFYDNQEQEASGNLLLQQENTISEIYFPNEIRVEESVQFLELPNTTPKEKELLPAAHHSKDNLCDNKEQHNSNGLLLNLNKGTIQKSKSESDIYLSSSKVLHATNSLTYIFRDP